MRKLRHEGRIFAIILFLSVSIFGTCQVQMFEPNKKMGKPTKDEYEMTTYPLDSAATAVCLVKKAYARYFYDEQADFRVEYEYEHRIKILSTEGLEYANVEIPYFDTGNSRNRNEKIIEISATSYNMENGKEVKTKMKKEMIFRERVNNNTMVLKFSIPAVKEGTIIEYKYRISSERYFEFRDWYAQMGIPIMYSEYDILIPEYFNYSLNTHGYEKIETVKEPESVSFSIRDPSYGMHTVDCRATRLRFYANQMPALKEDKHVWCINDYVSYISFELTGLTFPGLLYESYSNKWSDIDKMLLLDESFGNNLKLKNPFQAEMASLNLDKLSSVDAKVAMLYIFLKKKMKWNERYTLFASNIKKDIESGSGGNASLNFILMSMLRDAGIKCDPVVMSTRDKGRLVINRPSYSKLNTFVIAYYTEEGTARFIDSSILYGFIDILPPVLLVGQARIISDDKQGDKWVSTNIGPKNSKRMLVNAKISADGKINGKLQTSYSGQHVADYRASYKTAKDSAEFVANIEAKKDIKISSFIHENVTHFLPEVRAELEFEKEASVADSLIYVNPLIFLDKENNAFVQEERVLPVELNHSEDVTIISNINIPEGYEIIEYPQSINLKLENGGGSCVYICTPTATGVSVQYKFNLKNLIFDGSRYLQLRNFMGVVVEKNNEMLVLKKKP